MPLDDALSLVLQQFAASSPFVLAAKSGCDYDGRFFKIPFFNREYRLSFPEAEAEGLHLPQWLRLVFLHYLTNSSGVPISGEWITYRYLPGAQLFEGRFYNMAVRPLVRTFGHDLEGFKKACEALGGTFMDRLGDAAFRFMALPKFPMACIIYKGDEEVPPSGNILFDASAPHYLSTEEAAYLGEYLVESLRRLR